MNRREFLVSSVGVCNIAGQLAEGQENLDPVKTQPETHKVLFENQFVRVIESSVQPGHTEVKHSHPHSVTVHLVDAEATCDHFSFRSTVMLWTRQGTMRLNIPSRTITV
jgi:hypothetical protein